MLTVASDWQLSLLSSIIITLSMRLGNSGPSRFDSASRDVSA